ncbi:DMT family transporter [Motilimonas cestriensis]|uniref:DMT family transporter n=1 Tax=Motilimonas cestriensis TaxID=2742685 RepID=A0ABS8W4R9_9GAMM|nr:DMT family transporter [Motilimonas cestriensis]MCE2593518.1 DMT family transporter [Motilimonas cestriensis]
MPANLSLTIAMIIWGSSYIALKHAIQFYPPEWVMFLRMSITLICCACLWRWVRQFNYQSGDWKLLLLMSAAEPCLFFWFEGQALLYTSAAQAGVLVSCLPIFVAVLAWFFLKERCTSAIAVGFLFCIGGSILLSVVSNTSEHAPNPLLGNALEMGAMFFAAVYTLCVKKLSTRYSPLSLIALQGISGSLFFAPQAFAIPFPAEQDLMSLFSIVYLGAFVTIGAYGLYNYAIAKVSVLKVAAFSNLIPVFALLLAVLLLGETISLLQGLAIACIFIGVYISQQHKKTAPAAEKPIGQS